jgi:hypothetical protein
MLEFGVGGLSRVVRRTLPLKTVRAQVLKLSSRERHSSADFRATVHPWAALIYASHIQFEKMNVRLGEDYGEPHVGRLLALVITERGKAIRVITAYDLDAGQKHDYLERRLKQG